MHSTSTFWERRSPTRQSRHERYWNWTLDSPYFVAYHVSLPTGIRVPAIFIFFGFTSIWRRLLMESDAKIDVKIDAKSTPNRRKPKIANTHTTLRFRWRCLFQKPPISIRVIVVSPLINLGSIEVDYDRKSYDDHTPYFICNWSTSFDFLLSYLMEFFLLYTTLHKHANFKKMMFQHKVVTGVNYSSKR